MWFGRPGPHTLAATEIKKSNSMHASDFFTCWQDNNVDGKMPKVNCF